MLGDSLIQPNHKKCKISVYLRGGLKLLLGTVEREREKSCALYECVSSLRLPILVNYYVHQSKNIRITSSNCMVCNANPYIPHYLILRYFHFLVSFLFYACKPYEV